MFKCQLGFEPINSVKNKWGVQNGGAENKNPTQR